MVDISIMCGMIANVTSNMAFVPQIIKSYRRKSVEDISIGMFSILFFTQLCWIIYAIPIHAYQLIMSSSIEIILLLPIFIMYCLYSRPGQNLTDLSKTPIDIVSDS